MGYSRSDVQATKNRMKKFVRYKVGAEMYSIHYNYKPKNMNEESNPPAMLGRME